MSPGADRLRILLVEDDDDDFLLTRDLLHAMEGTAAEVEWVRTLDAGLAALEEGRHDICLLDYRLGADDGLDLLRQAVRRGVAAPIILLTGQGDRALDLDAMRAGAADYLVKGQIDAPLLERSIRYTIERKHAEQRQRFLVEATAILSSSLEVETTLQNVARLAVDGVADGCVIFVRENDGSVAELASAHADPAAEPVLQRVATALQSLMAEESTVLGRVWRSGRPALVRNASDALARVLAARPELEVDAAGLALHQCLLVPLLARGHSVGVLSLMASSPARAFDPDDIALAEELGRRAALALDNARLHREAKRAVRARDEILGIVSHDLRSPLHVVLSGTELLRTRLGRESGGGNADAMRHLDMIDRAVDRMNRLIQDLLDVTSIEAGRMSTARRGEAPAALIREGVESALANAVARNRTIGVDAGEDLPQVMADRHRILQVLANLLENALRAAPDGGTVTLSAVAEGDEVRFTVADDGAGIPEENLPHLFDRFWRGRPAGSGGSRGTGLGLPIAKGIVEAHGGRIWVESPAGAGTSVHFTLPTA